MIKTLVRGIIPVFVYIMIVGALQAPSITPTWWQCVLIFLAVDLLMTIQSFVREVTR